MTSSKILTGLLSLGMMGTGVLCAASTPDAANARASGANVSSQQADGVLANDLVELRVQTAGRKLANMIFTDKLNGRTYDLGPDFFSLVIADSEPDEFLSKEVVKESTHVLRASDLAAGKLTKTDIPGDPKARRLVERANGSRLTLPFAKTDSGLQLTWWAEVREGHPYVRIGLTILPEQGSLPAREITVLDFSAPEAEVVGSVKGAPVVAAGRRLFAGVEHPLSVNEADKGRVTAKIKHKTDLPNRAATTVSSVLGVSNPSQLRRTFQLAYLNEERARPYGAFLNYNSWYDIGYFDPYDEKAAMNVVQTFGEELVRKRGVVLDSFLFDDGWDDTQTLWKFHKGLPNEFRDIRKLAESYGAAPGVWFSPWGGYGKPKENRLAAANGKFETNESGFALAGPKYYDHFRDMCLHMIRENGINHFKLDGTSGVERLIPGSKFASDFEAIINLIDGLRKERPDLYVNLTTGTWASPFWFGIADSIWRGGWDHEFIGEGSDRNQWMTFRDGQIYANNVAVSPLFPINSLMTHGVIYTKRARNLQKVEGNDLTNEIWSGFGSGTQMQEMYITPSLLTQPEWDTLAAAAKWARNNEGTLVDTHWVGGDPAKLDVYGWAAWSPEKGILTLRNPSSVPQTWSFEAASVFELPVGAPLRYKLSSPKGDKLPVDRIEAGKPVSLTLQPYEVVVLEATPE